MKTKSFMERGQALILITLAAIGLFGIVGLAVDGSAKFSDRRHAQNAADAGALAAALTKTNGLTNGETDSVCSTASGYTNSTFCLDIIYAAWDRAEQNGYDGLTTNSVDVYSPPIDGPYAGKSSYVQVIVSSTVNTFFARVLGINQTQNTVEAVALSGKGGSIANGASVVSMNPNPNCSAGGGSGGGSFDVGGNGEIHLSGGGMFVNSTESCGYSQTSCTVTLTMSGGVGISSAGSDINQACGTPVPEDEMASHIVIPDEIYYPDVPAECGMTGAPTPTLLGVAADGKQEWLIYPGFYEDFPQAGLIPNNKHIYMASGIYCIDPPMSQDLQWSGASFLSLNGSTDPVKNPYQAYNPDGVTLYIKSGGGFSFSINSPIYLDATTSSGEYQGYLIILEGNFTTHPSCILNGGSYLDINGTVFAPYCNITINGDNATDSQFNAQIIGWDVKLNGGNVINIHYDPDDNAKIKRRVGLMR